MYDLDEEDGEMGNMNLCALVDLRDQLTNVCSPKTMFSEKLLESVDMALDKIINEEIIQKKK